MINSRFNKGFSLLELLVTIAIFGTVLSLLLTSYFQSNKQNQIVGYKLELRQEMRVLMQLIADDFKNSVYLDEYMSRKNKPFTQKSGLFVEDLTVNDRFMDRVHMHVHKRSMSFREVPFERDPQLHEVSIYLEKIEQEELQKRDLPLPIFPKDSQDLVYKSENSFLRFVRREEFYVDENIQEGLRSRFLTLSYNVYGFNLRFLQAVGTDNKELWIDNWDSELVKNNSERIPQAIEIDLTLLHPSGEVLREIRQFNIRPKLGNSVNWNY